MYGNEEFEDRWATPAEACREYAANVGREDTSRYWILTDYDTVETNPFYRGPACVKGFNPYYDGEESVEFIDLHSACWAPENEGGKCLHGYGAPVYGPKYEPVFYGPTRDDDEDYIPF